MSIRLTKLDLKVKYRTHYPLSSAGVAELADALRSGRSEITLVWVQIPPSAQLDGTLHATMERA